MIRPHHFLPNPQTLADNGFQSQQLPSSAASIAKAAYHEVSQAYEVLTSHGIKVHLFEDDSSTTPDSVFPNNWFSSHHGGQLAIYPMYAKNRRLERRADIIAMLKQNYYVQHIIDYSGLEQDNIYLEGTGAMVLDHIERVAYTVNSKRANPQALASFCSHFNYQAMLFDASDNTGKAIYHSNVLMAIASQFVLIAPEMITQANKRDEILQRLKRSGREIITLTAQQITQFCGNGIELQGKHGALFVVSSTAYNALSAQQIATINQSAQLVPINVSTIELAGGSIRCMLAGIHLSPR
ncbi:hypothetical protein SAMN05216262_104181 [Colwellia chukchiensis]|uniref:Amidinotransferase n=1 Tax=Colwellia chukchiensis TaxID=641665 RepID=A0A1H7LJX9_9GAMM|nr:arginine deiminase-related protein [Colwellia chukchiensis]SEK99058.1 hypothetical protein SAMN05216262_104181 [Colwellia chukchiensis]